MNIDHFIYFIETVKKQSFTKAAESLFISQSTIKVVTDGEARVMKK